MHTFESIQEEYYIPFCGEGGIRTPGTLLGVRQFSKLLLSATQAPLLISKNGRQK
jgi:hypothetical protein